MMRILLAEDEDDLREVTVKRLKAEGFGVDGCRDGQEALEYLDAADYNLVILDIMMPRLDGLSVLRKLRKGGNPVPVLLLTAKDAVSDRVQGLDAGADDYLVKPFAFDELLARLRVMIRRLSDSTSDVFSVADLTVDCTARTVQRNGQVVSLSSKEFAILEYMIRNSGIVLSREKISHHIWNYDYEGGSNVVDVYIRYLRKKLDDGYEPKLIHTVRGAGYVLREDK